MSYLGISVASGSVLGRDHRPGSGAYRNCQDAYYVAYTERSTIAVLADGCGSGTHSEVGAALGVRLIAGNLQRELDTYGFIRWSRVQQHLLADLDTLVRQLGGNYRRVVEEYFLFTLVGVVIHNDVARFFALGDGVLIVNGLQYPLGPFAGNMPPYLGYGLIVDDLLIDPKAVQLNTVVELPISQLESFLLGSDGVLDLIHHADSCLPGMTETVGDVSQFWLSDRYFGDNTDLVSRRLRMIARDWPRKDPDPGLLPDDTTIIAGRRLIAPREE